FQAEDGIRDFHVTGVQTCALPIFANLYWFRYDWFQRPDLKAQFRDIYGYELGVPVNWSAYEDIAEFFTEHVREIDGVAVYGHMEIGRASCRERVRRCVGDL